MNLTPLVAPRSIAVLGASERSALGRWIVESLSTLGFAGDVWPVNPKFKELLGRRCYESLRDLPAAPDVTAFCIGRAGVVASLEDLAARGGRAAVVYDSGFAERDEEGRRAQARMLAICEEAGIALCGPNCMGILNPVGRSSTFKQTIRDAATLAGNIGLVSQSGSICGTLLADLRRFGFSRVISCGNEAVTTMADYIDYLAADPDTKVIATFTESVRDAERYVAALDHAADRGKPVVVLRVGRNERTRQAIASHTGGLSGETRVFSEVLRAHRAIEVTDLDEMTEVLAACQGTRWPTGKAINILTTSGGQAELILDIATTQGVALTPLPQETRARVEREVGSITGDGNPLDAWGTGDVRANMPPALAALDQNPGTEVVVFSSSDSMDDQPLGRAGRELDYANILADAAQASDKPFYMMTMRPGVVHRGQIERLAQAGVPVVSGIRQGLRAITSLADWGAPRRALRPLPPPAATPLSGARRIINESDAKILLAAAGIPVTRETLVHTRAEATSAARALGYPVVLKVAADAIPHKSEHGLVRVALADDAALGAAFDEMERVVARLGVPVQGWLVQEMVSDGIEVFAGVSRDPEFGLSLAFGMGGVAVEVMRDFALRMLPLREGDAEEMIAQVRGAALLGAIRGKPAADVPALVRCLEALSDFAMMHRDTLAEIDLNPLKVRTLGKGCVAVDALIVTRAPGWKPAFLRPHDAQAPGVRRRERRKTALTERKS